MPGRYRWPTTLVLGFFLAIILVNLAFGASARTVVREFRIAPGEEQATSIFVDASRNAQVAWILTSNDDPPPEIEAIVTGPDFISRLRTDLEGRILFKGGFSRGEYTFSMRNLSPESSGVWRIEWTVR